MSFTKLASPITLRRSQLSALAQIYPYDLWGYHKLNEEARQFLAKNFSKSSGCVGVVGITNHNGYGCQWGIILFQDLMNMEWQIVAQFGHRTGGLVLRLWFVRWLSRYFRYENHALEHPHTLQSLAPRA